MIPAILNNKSGFKDGDKIYTLYKDSINKVEPCYKDNRTTMTLLGKDKVTISSNISYALVQIRNITVITSGGNVPLDKFKFVLERANGSVKKLVLRSSALSQQITRNGGVSGDFEDNLLNGTIGTNNTGSFLNFVEDSSENITIQTTPMRTQNYARIFNRETALKKKSLIDNSNNTYGTVDSWLNFDENAFANPVVFYSTVFSMGECVIEDGDMLAAYVKKTVGGAVVEELRGVSGTTPFDWNLSGLSNAINPVKIIQMTIFTNAVSSTELVKFKLFKKNAYTYTSPSGGDLDNITMLNAYTIYDLDQELAVGNIASGIYSDGPSTSNIFYVGRFTKTLQGPYDDFSYNIDLDLSKKEDIFGSNIASVKAYRSQDYTAIQSHDGSTYSWFSSTMANGQQFHNSNLNKEEFYSVRLVDSNSIKIQLDGKVNYDIPAQINLSAGYNWIGYLPNKEHSVGTLLDTNITSTVDGSNNLKAVISRSEGSVLYNPNGSPSKFLGSLVNMRPGGGYVVYVNGPATLTYPGPTVLNEPTPLLISKPGVGGMYYRLESFDNPISAIANKSDMWVYIKDDQTEIGFVYQSSTGRLTGIKHTGTFSSLGKHELAMGAMRSMYGTTYTPVQSAPGVEDYEMITLGQITGKLREMKLDIGFTTDNFADSTPDKANGEIDFKIYSKLNPNIVLTFASTAAAAAIPIGTVMYIGGSNTMTPPTGIVVSSTATAITLKNVVGEFLVGHAVTDGVIPPVTVTAVGQSGNIGFSNTAEESEYELSSITGMIGIKAPFKFTAEVNNPSTNVQNFFDNYPTDSITLSSSTPEATIPTPAAPPAAPTPTFRDGVGYDGTWGLSDNGNNVDYTIGTSDWSLQASLLTTEADGSVNNLRFSYSSVPKATITPIAGPLYTELTGQGTHEISNTWSFKYPTSTPVGNVANFVILYSGIQQSAIIPNTAAAVTETSLTGHWQFDDYWAILPDTSDNALKFYFRESTTATWKLQATMTSA